MQLYFRPNYQHQFWYCDFHNSVVFSIKTLLFSRHTKGTYSPYFSDLYTNYNITVQNLENSHDASEAIRLHILNFLNI